MTGVRVRFAPSPTGSLHLGNARTALFNWLFARHHKGVFILRVEDTDIEREVEGAEERLLKDLDWLGLDWDEGPDTGGPYGPYRQSERSAHYQQQAARLVEAGSAYPCFCSPERLEEDRRRLVVEGKTPRYLGHCAGLSRPEARRRLEGGERAALRLRIANFPVVSDLLRGEVDFTSRQPSDPVLVRSDQRPTYNFAVVLDDLAMKITHVLRGDDHLSNTPVQVRIYEALGATPPLFAHLPRVLGPDGAPLSKRHGAASLGEMRRRGYPPEALASALLLLGWTPPSASGPSTGGDGPMPLPEAAAAFELEQVSLSPASFDRARLDHLGSRVIAALEPQERARRLVGWIEEARAFSQAPGRDAASGETSPANGSAGEPLDWLAGLPETGRWSPHGLEWLGRVLDLWSSQVCQYSEYKLLAKFVFRFEERIGERSHLLGELASEPSRRVLKGFSQAMNGLGPLETEEKYLQAAQTVGKLTGAHGHALFHPLRVALTAAESGPELRRLVPLLDTAAGAGLPVRVLSAAERVDYVLQLVQQRTGGLTT